MRVLLTTHIISIIVQYSSYRMTIYLEISFRCIKIFPTGNFYVSNTLCIVFKYIITFFTSGTGNSEKKTN